MINAITLRETASYTTKQARLSELSELNFIFGSNGTGKTTISRLIADEQPYSNCTIEWKGDEIETLVYNRDFVEQNFSQLPELKGVFTLGEEQIDTQKKIEEAKRDEEKLSKKIGNLSTALQGDDKNGGKRGELKQLEDQLTTACWNQKKKHAPKLKEALRGCLGSQESFKKKILRERATNKQKLLTLRDLETRVEIAFNTKVTNEAIVAIPDTQKLITHETNEILTKQIIGKNNVDIAAMIKKLNNSDWVHKGRDFHNANERTCPFCQQRTTKGFNQSLNEYFDETFATDSKAIEGLAHSYETDANLLQQQLSLILDSSNKFLETEKLEEKVKLAKAAISQNIVTIARKKAEASQAFSLEPLGNICAAIKDLIDEANTRAREHNKIVANIETEKKTRTAQVWRFILGELSAELSEFENNERKLRKAILSITEDITRTTSNRNEKRTEIRNLEKQTTSTQPTITNINNLLSSFGFNNFKLAKAHDGTSYKLIRPDGSDAKTTLSEGEKTFVTFLYFYHRLKGSDSDSGMTADRIVVFDDPVSSLDSDILFIVSSLIKALFDEVWAKTGHIKQIFILTHNVYFHKEVTFTTKGRRRGKGGRGRETFWIVRKSDEGSSIEKHQTNPIKTSYELLWSEIRGTGCSNLTIQNTLRRILENYFKILGGIDPDEICDKFTGNSKFICKSLFAWVNDGSHFTNDGLDVAITDTAVDTYRDVFREIFSTMGHAAHYEMMMNHANADKP